MAKQIDGNDIIKDGALDNHIAQLKEILELNKQIDAAVVKTAKDVKKLAQSSDMGKAEDIAKMNKALQDSNKLRKDSIALSKQKKTVTDQLKQAEDAEVKGKLRKQEADKKQRQILRDQIALEDKQIGTLKRLQVENRQLRREREGLNLATQKGRDRLKDINSALDQNNKIIQQNSDKLKKQKINIGNYGSAVQRAQGILKGFAATLVAAFSFQAIKGFFTSSIAAFQSQEKAVAKVNQALKSTQNAAGKTSEELQKLASDLQKTTLFGDEEILNNATAQLLTFTNIAGTNFDRTQKVALDLATVLDGDLKSASIQLGKALNDPIANLSALSRSGIQFSKSQKDLIKSLAESGQLAEAQTVILDELERQYGGQAEAAAEADGGLTQLSNAFGDFREKVGRVLVDTLRPIIKSLKEFFENISEGDIQKFISNIKNLAKAFTIVITTLQAYRALSLDITQINSKLSKSIVGFLQKLGPIGIAVAGLGAAVGALVNEFTKLSAGQEAIARATEKANEKVDDEKIKLQELGEQLNKTTAGSRGRKEVIDEINATYGTTLQNLSDEAEFLKQVEQAYKSIVAQIEKKALAQALEEELVNAQKAVFQIQRDIKSGEIAGDFGEILLEQAKGAVKELSNEIANLQKTGEKIAEGKGGPRDLGDRFGKAAENIDKTTKSVKDLNKAVSDFSEDDILGDFDLEEGLDGVDFSRKKLEEFEIEQSIIDERNRLAEKAIKDEERREQLRLEQLKKFRDQSVQILKDIADARQRALDKQINARKEEVAASNDEISRLRALGTAEANEAIKAERIKQAKEKKEIEELEKKKRNLLIQVTALERASQLIGSGNQNPFAAAQAQIGNFINNLQGFYDGTEGTVADSLGRTGTKDGHVVRVHDNEHIIGANDSDKLHAAGLTKNKDIVESALAYQNQSVNKKALAINKPSLFSDAKIVEELKSVKKAIKNIKIVQQHIDISSGKEVLIEGNKKTINNHNPRSFKI